MPSGGKIELKILIGYVQVKKCTSVNETRNAIQSYFNDVIWSILKDEWKQMTRAEQWAFAERLYEVYKLHK